MDEEVIRVLELTNGFIDIRGYTEMKKTIEK